MSCQEYNSFRQTGRGLKQKEQINVQGRSVQNSYDDADDGDSVDEYIVIMIGEMFLRLACPHTVAVNDYILQYTYMFQLCLPKAKKAMSSKGC